MRLQALTSSVRSTPARLTRRRKRETLAALLASGEKPKAYWRIGTEYEKFGFLTDSRTPLPYAGERSISALFAGIVLLGAGWRCGRHQHGHQASAPHTAIAAPGPRPAPEHTAACGPLAHPDLPTPLHAPHRAGR